MKICKNPLCSRLIIDTLDYCSKECVLEHMEFDRHSKELRINKNEGTKCLINV